MTQVMLLERKLCRKKFYDIDYHQRLRIRMYGKRTDCTMQVSFLLSVIFTVSNKHTSLLHNLYITNLSCFIVHAQCQFTGSPIILSTAFIALKIHPCYLEMGCLAKPSAKLCLLWQGILNEGEGSVQLTNSLRQLVL